MDQNSLNNKKASWGDIVLKAFIGSATFALTNAIIYGAYDVGKYYVNKEERERTYQLNQKQLDLKLLIAHNKQNQQELDKRNIKINEDNMRLQKEQACIDRWNLMHAQWQQWCTSADPEIRSLCEQTKAGIIAAFNNLPPSYIENNNENNELNLQKDTQDEDA
jgi:hypothetical protein